MHQRTKLGRLFNGAGIDGDHRNTAINRIHDRAFKHVEIGDGDNDAIRVGGRCLLDNTGHIGQIAGRRVAVINRDFHLVACDLDGILDGVPPAVRVRCMADQNEFFVFCRSSPGKSGKGNGSGRNCGQSLLHR